MGRKYDKDRNGGWWWWRSGGFCMGMGATRASFALLTLTIVELCHHDDGVVPPLPPFECPRHWLPTLHLRRQVDS